MSKQSDKTIIISCLLAAIMFASASCAGGNGPFPDITLGVNQNQSIIVSKIEHKGTKSHVSALAYLVVKFQVLPGELHGVRSSSRWGYWSSLVEQWVSSRRKRQGDILQMSLCTSFENSPSGDLDHQQTECQSDSGDEHQGKQEGTDANASPHSQCEPSTHIFIIWTQKVGSNCCSIIVPEP